MQEVDYAELRLQRDKAVSMVEKLEQRISDLFGPEAGQLDALKAQTVQAKKGNDSVPARLLIDMPMPNLKFHEIPESWRWGKFVFAGIVCDVRRTGKWAGRRKDISAQKEAQLVNVINALQRTLQRNEKEVSSAVPLAKYRQASLGKEPPKKL